MKKTCVIIIMVVLLVSIPMIAQYEYASATDLFIPQFTAKYIDLSYDIAPTYGVDQYTGETVVKQDGYHVDNRSIQFTIKNQPFTPTMDPSGNQTNLYYNFRIKGAYGTDWDYFPFAPSGWSTRRYGGLFGGNSTESPEDLAQSNAEYTTLAIQIPGVYRVPAKAQLEVQVQAIIGYMYPTDHMLAGYAYFFTGQYGDWSSTQALTVGESTTTALSPTNLTANPTTLSPTTTATLAPTGTPLQLYPQSNTAMALSCEQIVIVILCIVVTALAVALILAHQKNRRNIIGVV
jgi:hypothetical protein